MSDQFDWSVPPLDPADQRLVEAYKTSGRSLDDLPYTPEFERLFQLLGLEDTDDARHFTFRRLLNLRKRGQLPSVSLSNRSLG